MTSKWPVNQSPIDEAFKNEVRFFQHISTFDDSGTTWKSFARPLKLKRYLMNLETKSANEKNCFWIRMGVNWYGTNCALWILKNWVFFSNPLNQNYRMNIINTDQILIILVPFCSPFQELQNGTKIIKISEILVLEAYLFRFN